MSVSFVAACVTASDGDILGSFVWTDKSYVVLDTLSDTVLGV